MRNAWRFVRAVIGMGVGVVGILCLGLAYWIMPSEASNAFGLALMMDGDDWGNY